MEHAGFPASGGVNTYRNNAIYPTSHQMKIYRSGRKNAVVQLHKAGDQRKSHLSGQAFL
jgi:hypothetical protein